MSFPFWIWLFPVIAGLIGYIIAEILLEKVGSIIIKIKMKGGESC